MKLELKKSSLVRVEKTFKVLLYVIGFGLILHAPMTVWLSSAWPSYDVLFKAWKEILLVVAFILAGLIYLTKKPTIPHLGLVKLIVSYKLLHILAAIIFFQGLMATLAGFMIDLRYLAFFLLVMFAAKTYEDFVPTYLKLMFIGGAVVSLFALMQVYVLPADILSHIGYGRDTILPYQTVDQNHDFIRINSTLRGPNPLGAYMVMFITIFGVYVYKNYKKFSTKQSWLMAFVMVGALVGLWFSYSRSALLAMGVSGLIVLAIMFGNKINRKVILAIATLALVVSGALFAARDSYFVSNVILHNNVRDDNEVDSNRDHAESLVSGFEVLTNNPFGRGVGSTGSASLYGNSPFIIENQYLFIAHEVGWLGLGLFLTIQFYIFKLLWQKRKNWLAMSVFASGVGIAIIGLLLPVWADDTVSMLWWGMAGLVLGAKRHE